MVFRVPNIEERTTVIGKTGSGKTQGGAFILSESPFDVIPYVILDFKGEQLFKEIPRIREIELTNKRTWEIINQPGLCIIRPMLNQIDELEEFLWFVWEHENCGIFVDEGYRLSKSDAYQTLLTQGRSKHTPVITLIQRPRFVTGFALSEADFLMVFRVTKPEDRKTIQDYVDGDISRRLPRYWSYWYDVEEDQLAVLRPVPDRTQIVRKINDRLELMYRDTRAKQFV